MPPTPASSPRRCVVNVATGRYAPLQARLIQSLRWTQASWNLLTWTDWPPEMHGRDNADRTCHQHQREPPDRTRAEHQPEQPDDPGNTKDRRIEQLLLHTNRARGITTVVVSHDVASTLRMADHVVLLQDGQAVCGPPADLVRSTDPRVRAFFGDGTSEAVA